MRWASLLFELYYTWVFSRINYLSLLSLYMVYLGRFYVTPKKVALKMRQKPSYWACPLFCRGNIIRDTPFWWVPEVETFTTHYCWPIMTFWLLKINKRCYLLCPLFGCVGQKWHFFVIFGQCWIQFSLFLAQSAVTWHRKTGHSTLRQK